MTKPAPCSSCMTLNIFWVCWWALIAYEWLIKQESLANAKVSDSSACMKAPSPSEDIYGKSTQGTYVEKYIHWVTTLSLTIRVYLHSFGCCCLPNRRNPAKFLPFSRYWRFYLEISLIPLPAADIPSRHGIRTLYIPYISIHTGDGPCGGVWVCMWSHLIMPRCVDSWVVSPLTMSTSRL